MKENNHREWTIFALGVFTFQMLVDIVVFTDFPVARQVLGFIYLTFVPGAVLLMLFRLDGLNLAQKVLFSTGLSLVLVMLVGLIASQVGLSLNPSMALSTHTMLLAMNIVVLSFCALSYFLGINVQFNTRKLNFPLHWVLPAFIPVLAIIGVFLANLNGNSVVLVVMLGAVALTALISLVITRVNLSLIIFMITVAVVLYGSLISNYIVGLDVHPAYHVFKITQESGVWNSVINETDPVIARTNQMLSLTVLPTIYSNVLGMEGTWIFKIVFPLIFAFVPLGLYELYQRYVDKRIAFAAAFLILADITFYREMPGLPSQMIAELFLILSLMVIFFKEISPSKKLILFTIFSIGLITSHYAISYFFMVLIVFAWLAAFLKKKQAKIKLTYIILFFVLAFSWYVYTSQSASFNSLLDMGQNIYTSFWSDLLNPQSRPEEVLKAVGMGEPATSIGHWLGRGFRYASELFIILGFVSLLLKRGSNNNGFKFDREYIVMAAFMLAALVSILVAPSFNLLNITRLYHLSILFLAPFCIIGGSFFFSTVLRKRKSYLPFFLTMITVTALFLFETNFVYEVTGDVSYSPSLSMYRMNRVMIYGKGSITESEDVAGARWLHSNIVITKFTMVYADIVAAMGPLTSYGVFPRDQTEIISNASLLNRQNAYVYMRAFNTIDGKIFGREYAEGRIWNTSDLNPQLTANDKIYTNGGTEIYFIP